MQRGYRRSDCAERSRMLPSARRVSRASAFANSAVGSRTISPAQRGAGFMQNPYVVAATQYLDAAVYYLYIEQCSGISVI